MVLNFTRDIYDNLHARLKKKKYPRTNYRNLTAANDHRTFPTNKQTRLYPDLVENIGSVCRLFGPRKSTTRPSAEIFIILYPRANTSRPIVNRFADCLRRGNFYSRPDVSRGIRAAKMTTGVKLRRDNARGGFRWSLSSNAVSRDPRMKFSSNEISSRASNRISRSPVTYSRWQKNTIFWSLSGHGNRSRTVYLPLARPARFHARVRTYVRTRRCR